MAAVTFANRARMSTSTLGTGTITLGAATVGYMSFSEAGIADGNTISYAIEDGNNFEVGHGVYSSSGSTLTRSVVASKINGLAADTTPISLSGSAIVFATLLAEDVNDFAFLDLLELASAGTVPADTARVFALDVDGTTTVAMKDSAGNTRSLSHFKQTGTGASVRSQVSKLQDVLSVMDFGADPTGTNDSRAAFQAAIDAAAALTTARGTVHIPATANGCSYKLASPVTWKANVNIDCDAQVRIFASATMAALLQTDVGSSGVRLRNVWLRGGRWDGAFLAQRGIWIKDGNGVHMSDFLIRQVGAYVDGVSESESSYIRIGDPAQFTSCYEIMVNNFFLGRADDSGSPSLCPANNYGIYSTDGASDCHIQNGVISGVKYGIADEMAHWKIDTVHVWNFQAGHGPLINGFYDSIGGVIITNAQVDCATYEVPFRFEGTSTHPSVLIGSQVHCIDGTDNTGHAIEIGSGVKVTASANVITCPDVSHRFATDFTGTLANLSVFGHENNNVVAPAVQVGRISRSVNGNLYQHIIQQNTGAAGTAGLWAETNAGTAFVLARTTAGGASAIVDWTGSGGLFVSAGSAGGALSFQTDYTTRLSILATSGVVVAGHTAAITMNGSITPKLQLHSTGTGNASYVGARWSNDASGAQIGMGKSRGAVGTHTVVQSADSLGRLRFEGSDGDEFIAGASIEAFVDGTPGNNDMPGRLAFSTTADGAATVTERMRISSTGAITALTATGGLGYGTGAGSTVTQITSKSTGVTLNNVCGRITTHNATLNAGTEVGFAVTNSAVAATDVVIVNMSSGGTFDSYQFTVDSVTAGAFRIQITNVSASNLGEALVLNFAVIKAVTS